MYLKTVTKLAFPVVPKGDPHQIFYELNTNKPVILGQSGPETIEKLQKDYVKYQSKFTLLNNETGPKSLK